MTPLDSTLASAPLALFGLVAARVGALMLVAPIFGSRAVPVRVRLLLALSIAAVVAPICLAAAPQPPHGKAEYLLALGGELAIGLLIGLGLRILFGGVQLAAQIIAQLSGLGLAEVFDPGLDAGSTVFSQVFFLLASAIFLRLDGHRLAVGALLDTFQAMPPGAAVIAPHVVETLTTLLVQSFHLGIQAAAPVATALIAATLILGLVSRTLPQLNILAIGFGLNTLLALAVLLISLGGVAWALEDRLEPTFELLRGLVENQGAALAPY